MDHGNQKDRPRLLIVGAFAPEIDELSKMSSAASSPKKDDPASPTAAQASRRPYDFEVLEAGIGSVAAAVSVQARLLDRDRPPIDEVLFLGSAGAYDAEVPVGPGRFGFSTEFCKRDLAVLEARAHAPAETGAAIRAKAGDAMTAIRAGFDGDVLREGICNSTDSVSLVAIDLKAAGRGFECDFENLECFGVAFVCRSLGLPFAALLALTNTVGPGGSEQWRENYRAMSLELQASVRRSLL